MPLDTFIHVAGLTLVAAVIPLSIVLVWVIRRQDSHAAQMRELRNEHIATWHVLEHVARWLGWQDPIPAAASGGGTPHRGGGGGGQARHLHLLRFTFTVPLALVAWIRDRPATVALGLFAIAGVVLLALWQPIAPETATPIADPPPPAPPAAVSPPPSPRPSSSPPPTSTATETTVVTATATQPTPASAPSSAPAATPAPTRAAPSTAPHPEAEPDQAVPTVAPPPEPTDVVEPSAGETTQHSPSAPEPAPNLVPPANLAPAPSDDEQSSPGKGPRPKLAPLLKPLDCLTEQLAVDPEIAVGQLLSACVPL